MDEAEQVVEQYLRRTGYNARFEPDGNIPPDFCIEPGCIAVEVSQLVPVFRAGAQTSPLATIEMALLKRVQRLIESFDRISPGPTYFLSYSYSRPFEAWSAIEAAISAALRDAATRPFDGSKRVKISASFELRIHRSAEPLRQQFVIGSMFDRDSCLWVLQELEKRINEIVHRKSVLVRPHLHKYPRWWLVLVDRLSRGISDWETQLILQDLRRPSEFEKIVVLQPSGFSPALEF